MKLVNKKTDNQSYMIGNWYLSMCQEVSYLHWEIFWLHFLLVEWFSLSQTFGQKISSGCISISNYYSCIFAEKKWNYFELPALLLEIANRWHLSLSYNASFQNMMSVYTINWIIPSNLSLQHHFHRLLLFDEVSKEVEIPIQSIITINEEE